MADLDMILFENSNPSNIFYGLVKTDFGWATVRHKFTGGIQLSWADLILAGRKPGFGGGSGCSWEEMRAP